MDLFWPKNPVSYIQTPQRSAPTLAQKRGFLYIDASALNSKKSMKIYGFSQSQPFFYEKRGRLYIDASALKSLGIFLRKVKTRMISGEIFYALTHVLRLKFMSLLFMLWSIFFRMIATYGLHKNNCHDIPKFTATSS